MQQNQLEYDRFFKQEDEQPSDQTLDKALEKMLQELKEKTSQPIERIHQYLCKQTDEKLFKGILTDGKSIKGAFTYCSEKALEQAQKEPYAMVEDETVFQWVKDYFILYELPKKVEKKQATRKKQNIVKKEPVNNVTPLSKEPISNETGGSEQQIDLFATV